MKDIIDYVRNNGSQAHLCICNDSLFEGTITNGVYGFPHAGINQLKSFWRAVSSMYNIGPNDLVFLYRTKGDNPGCQEINGPFKVYGIGQKPAIYYDQNSRDFPMFVEGETDCKVRFLFESFDNKVYSITDNYGLIKKFESKEIWGYRHPAVMNIGAARKKSVTSFTNKQTLLLLDMIQKFGKLRYKLKTTIPAQKRVGYYTSLSKSKRSFKLDDDFLLSANTNDEAFLYGYILRAIKTPTSLMHREVISDFSAINDGMIKGAINKGFTAMTANAMMEVIISPHLQDELDVVLLDSDDQNMLFFEVKEGAIKKEDVIQTQEYVDLLKAIFPAKNIFANVIGSGKDNNVVVDRGFSDRIKLVEYSRKGDRIRFAGI